MLRLSCLRFSRFVGDLGLILEVVTSSKRQRAAVVGPSYLSRPRLDL